MRSFVLTNVHGLRAVILDTGAPLAYMEIPDRNGTKADITLGVGVHSASRLGTPSGAALLKQWVGHTVRRTGASGVELCSLGGEGYAGACQMTYWLTDDDELEIDTETFTTRNPTDPIAWNLTGDPHKPILKHMLTIDADRVLFLDPSGRVERVDGMPFDLRQPRMMGQEEDSPAIQGGGDRCWILTPEPSNPTSPYPAGARPGVRFAARVVERESGRVMELFTDQPGVWFNRPDFLGKSPGWESGGAAPPRFGFILEPQQIPEASHAPSQPAAVHSPGEVYRSTTVYRFYTVPEHLSPYDRTPGGSY